MGGGVGYGAVSVLSRLRGGVESAARGGSMNICVAVRGQACYICVEPPAEVEAQLRCQDCEVFIAREAEAERLRERPELVAKAETCWDW